MCLFGTIVTSHFTLVLIGTSQSFKTLSAQVLKQIKFHLIFQPN
ncbi:MAG: hypothetical protein ACTS43_00280 [Candidatus Hodgkinia cicadicola]